MIGFGSRLFWRMEHKGVENIPQNSGLIIAANHQSYGDPFWLSIPVKRPIRFLAWSEAFSWPVVGKAIRLLGAWPLQVEGSDPAAIRRSLTWLRDGGVVVIFPEGGRGLPDGSMMRMKGGAVRMALEAGVPILPVTIRGANRVWPATQISSATRQELRLFITRSSTWNSFPARKHAPAPAAKLNDWPRLFARPCKPGRTNRGSSPTVSEEFALRVLAYFAS